ncbi:glutathione S-transferase, C-terminal domain protein [Asticcacaulis biprosthecium C19]|uniref:Glutathione S-transferase, C-terminal domain protein n=1 Tax=Asticcacaulis biprosthecium C19 TaxID=715226 RepID=F4QIV1_9CAUL|nr:glutathione S-transferase C-terminal domain-containing protein [Asticcacaulis biprosthecium]EGF93014.1 glutathione S-transferase, C-terminal domain protein [Asticcacaulis biprosthecium C19]
MIHLYTWGTPNGRKLTILMEELGVPYDIHPIDIGKDEQFAPDFLKISPNNKIPAIVDDEAEGGPLSLFESGAIMIYLADKYGQFLPASGAARYTAIQWLMWQMGGLGPMFGQLGWWVVSDKEQTPKGVERYAKEAERLMGVLDKRLSEAPYVGGDDYTIADMAIWPWISQYRTRVKDHVEPMVQKHPHVLAWLDRVGERPAVQKGFALP